MARLVVVLWLTYQVTLVHSWSRNNFSTSLCISWPLQDSGECLGGIAALTFKGIWLNTTIFVNLENGTEVSSSTLQWIDMNPGETVALTFDGVELHTSVRNHNATRSYNFTQLDHQDNEDMNISSGAVVREEYNIVQLEHGGGDCNCLQIYFDSICIPQSPSAERLLSMYYVEQYFAHD